MSYPWGKEYKWARAMETGENVNNCKFKNSKHFLFNYFQKTHIMAIMTISWIRICLLHKIYRSWSDFLQNGVNWQGLKRGYGNNLENMVVFNNPKLQRPRKQWKYFDVCFFIDLLKLFITNHSWKEMNKHVTEL